MHLLIGLSAIAVAATGAQAANNNSISSTGVGNVAECNNDTLGSNGNNCTITVVGNGDTAIVNQKGNSNTAVVEQRADGVYAFIEQGNADNDPNNPDYRVTAGNGISENNFASTRQLAGSNGSRSSTTQNGDGNSTSITQTGVNSDNFARVAGFTNTASVNQSGARSVSIAIVRDFAQNDGITTGPAQSNLLSVTQSGADTYSYIAQDGTGNRATVNLSGTGRTKMRPSTALSDDDRIAYYQQNEPAESVIVQVGSGNDGSLNQNGNLNSSSIYQVGSANLASASQSGNSNGNDILQGAFSGVATGNRATTSQGARSSYSYVQQEGSGNLADVAETTGNNLRSSVVQAGPNNAPVSGNSATVRLSNGNAAVLTNGVSNESQISQQSAGNRAVAVIAGGNAARNTSVITQTGSGATINNGDGSRGQFQSNDAFVLLSNGDQMASSVSQNGSANYAEVVMASGIAGTNPAGGIEGGRSGGNNATVNQISRGSVAAVTTQIARGAQFRGIGNNVMINQTGSVLFATRGPARANQSNAANGDRFAYTEFGSTQGNFTGSKGQYVETYQQGRFDTATVTQNVNGDSGRVYADGSIARSRAGIYQNASVDTATVTQTGDNYAEITQGFGQGSTVNLSQNDTGDITNPGTPGGTITVCDSFGNCTQQPDPNNPGTPTTFTRQYNQALVTQYGNLNSMALNQTARNGFVSAFQRTGSSNLVLDFEQGTGRTNNYSGSNSGGPSVQPAITGTAVAGASVNATAFAEQGGTNNGAMVSQDSSNSYIRVTQLGTGSSPVTAANFANGVNQGQMGGNVVIVAQQGSANRATAFQDVGVGRSAANAPASGNSAAQNTANNGGTATPEDDFYFAGGSRSAEIDILQGGSNNFAFASQAGTGQYARIEQAGTGNLAQIMQQSGATNATAIIRQSGSGNSYYVTQTLPGQYIAVNQFGTNNNANNIVTRGPAGGSAGFTPPGP